MGCIILSDPIKHWDTSPHNNFWNNINKAKGRRLDATKSYERVQNVVIILAIVV